MYLVIFINETDRDASFYEIKKPEFNNIFWNLSAIMKLIIFHHVYKQTFYHWMRKLYQRKYTQNPQKDTKYKITCMYFYKMFPNKDKNNNINNKY